MKITKHFDVWFLRGRLQFSYERHRGAENYCSGKEFYGWVAAWMTKTHMEQSLANPLIHILILIPVRRQSDSYFKQ